MSVSGWAAWLHLVEDGGGWGRMAGQCQEQCAAWSVTGHCGLATACHLVARLSADVPCCAGAMEQQGDVQHAAQQPHYSPCYPCPPTPATPTLAHSSTVITDTPTHTGPSQPAAPTHSRLSVLELYILVAHQGPGCQVVAVQLERPPEVLHRPLVLPLQAVVVADDAARLGPVGSAGQVAEGAVREEGCCRCRVLAALGSCVHGAGRCIT